MVPDVGHLRVIEGSWAKQPVVEMVVVLKDKINIPVLKRLAQSAIGRK